MILQSKLNILYDNEIETFDIEKYISDCENLIMFYEKQYNIHRTDEYYQLSIIQMIKGIKEEIEQWKALPIFNHTELSNDLKLNEFEMSEEIRETPHIKPTYKGLPVYN